MIDHERRMLTVSVEMCCRERVSVEACDLCRERMPCGSKKKVISSKKS